MRSVNTTVGITRSILLHIGLAAGPGRAAAADEAGEQHHSQQIWQCLQGLLPTNTLGGTVIPVAVSLDPSLPASLVQPLGQNSRGKRVNFYGNWYYTPRRWMFCS